jgi:precorrin-6B C5,15-methyltransferase / cobalt-precorrin-6B C5,C15-methyltransferase
MTAQNRWLSIIGIGEDGLDGLSPAARRLIAQAALVVGGARHLKLAALAGERALTWPSRIEDAMPNTLERRG